MASKLSFTFKVPLEKPSKAFQRKPNLSLSNSNLNYCDGFGFSKKNSVFRGQLSVKVNALQEEVTQSTNSETTLLSPTTISSSSKLVFVVGATGGVGSTKGKHWILYYFPRQLVVAALLNRNIRSRILLRDPEKAVSLFGNQDEEKLQIFKGDTRNPADLDPSMFEEQLLFLPRDGMGIILLKEAGRLTDGPYTSYDLNTLLQATAGQRCAVVIGQGDKLVGEVSRVVVAEACIQALDIEFTEGKIYEINSVEGEGPGTDPEKWQQLFKTPQV